MHTPIRLRGLFSRLVILLTFTFALTCAAYGQSATATLSGVITDKQGAVVADANVTLINATNSRRNTTTDDAGAFTISNLAPGSYIVRVEGRGFQEVVRDGVSINGETRIDFVLDAGGVSEQVTVTAQKREEEVTKVPITVNVINDRQIEQAGLTQFTDIQDYVPNLRITNLGGRATVSYITLRGFINSPISLDPAVAVYVDGVPVSDFFSQSQSSLFDVEQVEVLKGPQGSLYGVNSQAGVINITSRRPTNDTTYSFGGSFGSFKSYDAHFAVSVPIVKDKLFASLSGFIGGRDGFIKNVVSGNNYDDQFGFAGRLRVIYKPAPEWEIALTATGNKVDDKGGYIYLPTNLATFNVLPALGGLRLKEFEQAIDYEGFNRSTINQQALQITRYGRMFDFTYIGGRRENAQKYNFDADFTPLRFFNGLFEGNFKDWNHEFRVQSPRGDSDFEWTLGFTFNNNYRDYQTSIRAFTGNPFGFPPGDFTFADFRQTTKNYGVFGQGTYRALNDKLGLTAGLRYDKVNRDFARFPVPLGGPAFSAKYDDSIWLPKFSIDYRLTDDDLLYVTAGRGWRAGGYNPNADTIPNSAYRRETSWTYEAGAKTRWLNDRVFFNAAYFYNDVRDYHESIYGNGTLAANLGNAEKVRSYGADLEGAVNPASGLRFDGHLGLVKSEYVKYTYNIPLNLNLNGLRLRQVPNYDFGIGAQYNFAKSYFVRGEVNGTGEFNEYIINPNTGARQEFQFGNYAVVNVRGGYEAKRWSIIAFANNLADRQYFTYTEIGFSSLSGYAEPLGVVGARRVVGLRFNYRFGR